MSRRVACSPGLSGSTPVRVTLLAVFLQTGIGPAGFAADASAQEPPARVERALDHASRLLRAERPEEARRVLTSLLGERPESVAALALLFEVTGELGDPAAFLTPIATAARRGGTGQAALQALWVRGLLRAGLVEDAREVAERWVTEQEAEPRAYASLGTVDTAADRPDRAIEILERGRRRLGDRALFREQLAALYVETGRAESLVAEWIARLSERPPDLGGVHREVAALESPEPLLAFLWSTGRETRQEAETRHAIALLALRSGHAGPARRIATLALAALPADRRSGALAAYAREAELAELPAEAAWAASRLAETAGTARERWRWLGMAAEKALEAGDTASALRSTERLVGQSPPGSVVHTGASERLIALLAAQPANVDAAARQLEAYLKAHPDSSMKIASLSLAVARGHEREGRLEAARGVLSGAPLEEGPARHIVDAALAELELRRGEPGEALRLLRAAAADGRAPQGPRTRWISLLGILQFADSTEVAWLGRTLAAVVGAAATFDPNPLLTEWTRKSAGEGRAAALAYLGDSLEATGREDAAAAVRETLVEQAPDSPEAAAAMLSLARRALVADPALARVWLERVVTRFPDSVVAPLARRMLAELSGRTPAGE